MKTPRIRDFDPNALAPKLSSPFNNFPQIQSPRGKNIATESLETELKDSAEGTPPNKLSQSLFFSCPKEAQPQKRGNEEPRKRGIEDRRKRGSEEGSFLDTEEARNLGKSFLQYQFDLADDPDEKYGFVFTADELDALDDVKRDAKRKFGVKTSKQDLVRCAVQELIENFYTSGESSNAIQRIRRSRNTNKRGNE
jgi:hypothetical protein